MQQLTKLQQTQKTLTKTITKGHTAKFAKLHKIAACDHEAKHTENENANNNKASN